jgi:hypothetical protein
MSNMSDMSDMSGMRDIIFVYDIHETILLGAGGCACDYDVPGLPQTIVSDDLQVVIIKPV